MPVVWVRLTPHPGGSLQIEAARQRRRPTPHHFGIDVTAWSRDLIFVVAVAGLGVLHTQIYPVNQCERAGELTLIGLQVFAYHGATEYVAEVGFTDLGPRFMKSTTVPPQHRTGTMDTVLEAVGIPPNVAKAVAAWWEYPANSAA